MTPPQGYIPPVANVLATIGTVLWCIQLIPQIWHNYKRKRTEGMPGSMMFVWAVCAIPFGVYAIIQNFAPGIQLQPQVFGVLALICWGQVLYYERKWSKRRSIVAVVGVSVLFGLLEVMFVFTLRIPYRKGDERPVLAMGVIAAILLAAGIVPAYYEIWKRGGQVVGINWLFLATDWTGGFLSLLAVVFQEYLDVLGCSLYIVVIALEAGIFMSHGLWLLKQRIKGKGNKGAQAEDEEARPVVDGQAEAEVQTETREQTEDSGQESSEEGNGVATPADALDVESQKKTDLKMNPEIRCDEESSGT